MRRWSARILVCLSLGLLSTVAIAWLSAACDRSPFDSDIYHANGTRAQFASGEYVAFLGRGSCKDRVGLNYVDPLPGSSFTMGPAVRANPDDAATALPKFQRAGLFPHWWGRVPHIPKGSSGNEFGCVQDSRGWPLPALWCQWVEWSPAGFPSWMSPVQSGFEIPPVGTRSFETVRALPYRPIPIGLAADTLLFALAWSALLFTPRSLRRALRLRRGLCPACGYSLAGNTTGVCPECGSDAGNTVARADLSQT